MGGLLEREVLAAASEIVRRLRLRRRVWIVLEADGRIVVLMTVLLLLVAGCGAGGNAAGQVSPARAEATATRSPEQEWARRIVLLEWHVVEEYGVVSVVGELRNNNEAPVGVELLITAYDEDGRVVDSMNCWPASLQNVPAQSKYPINCPVTDRPGVAQVTLRVEGAKQW